MQSFSNTICEFRMRLGPELYSMTVFTSLKNSAPSVIKIHIHVDYNIMRETVCRNFNTTL